MELKVMRLVGGEDVVAMSEEQGETIKLKNPVQLIVTGEGVAMVPFTPYSEQQELFLKTQHVIYLLNPDQNVKNAYNSQFGSGIITATQGLQL